MPEIYQGDDDMNKIFMCKKNVFFPGDTIQILAERLVISFFSIHPSVFYFYSAIKKKDTQVLL